MKTYEYKGYDANGHVNKGLIEAMSVKDAREKLAVAGILAERVSQSGRHFRFPAETRAMVYHELSSLLGAGLPLVRSLDILIESPEMDCQHILLAGVRDRVKEGSSLADALADASDSLTACERAIIESAEKSATVEFMLERLAKFLEEQQKLHDRVQTALIYPSIVVAVGVCVAVLMLGLLVPRTHKLLVGTNVVLPGLTQFMMSLGSLILKWGWVAAAGVIGGVLYLKHKLKHDHGFCARWDRALFKIPLWGKGYTILVNLRFSRTLAILLSGGVSLIEGIALAGRATGSPWISQLTEEGAEQLRHGNSLSNVIQKIEPLSASLAGWIRAGEASGGLERLLENASDRYQAYWNRFAGKSISFLEPVIILVIGGFVLLITVSVLLPIVSLTRIAM